MTEETATTENLLTSESASATEAVTPAETASRPVNSDTPSFVSTLAEDLRADASLQSFKDADSLAKSYVELNKMRNQKVSEMTAEELKEISPSLGVPDSADKYELSVPDWAEEGEAISKKAQEAFLEMGIPKDSAEKIFEWYMQDTETQLTAQADDAARVQKAQIEEVHKEFGSAFDERIELANDALREFGGDEVISALNGAGLSSHPAIVKMLSKIGASTRQDTFAGQDSKRLFGTTPDEAANKIAELSKDKAFQERRRNVTDPGHEAAMQELDKLYRLKAGN